ncbi:hypothetical protein H5410_026544 [Solanum commersonii]|uniref:Uncharacterized protein n=1 Tax=Solanum commersonii TaxID=4109 RepID=A0A9J5Z0Z9_SOLCO|nr:hypothetical protein H5410_026544 [Solanum commersonii]
MICVGSGRGGSAYPREPNVKGIILSPRITGQLWRLFLNLRGMNSREHAWEDYRNLNKLGTGWVVGQE